MARDQRGRDGRDQFVPRRAGQEGALCQELDRVAQVLRVGEVARCEPADPLTRDRLRRDDDVEGEPAEDRELVGGVTPVDVGCRVGLGVAQALCLGEDIAVFGAALRHRGEHEVRGAVDDGRHVGDLVREQIARERADDRNAAPDRRLVEQPHAALGGEGEQLGTVLRHHLLVRGDDVAARAKRALDMLPRRLPHPPSARRRRACPRRRVSRPTCEVRWPDGTPSRGRPASRTSTPAQRERTAHAGGVALRPGLDGARHPGPDGPGAQERDPDRGCHQGLRA